MTIREAEHRRYRNPPSVFVECNKAPSRSNVIFSSYAHGLQRWRQEVSVVGTLASPQISKRHRFGLSSYTASHVIHVDTWTVKSEFRVVIIHFGLGWRGGRHGIGRRQ